MPESNELMSAGAQLIGMPLAGPESFSQQQLDYLKRALGVDETVLFDGVLQGSNGGTVDLAERLINFERIRITYKWNNSVTVDVAEIKEVVAQEGIVSYWDAGYGTPNGDKFRVAGWIDFRTPSKMNIITAGQDNINGVAMGYHGSYGAVYKVVGIHRIAGGN